MRGVRALAMAGGLALGVALAVGIAGASIPQDGVYTGCYMKSGGTLRVIDPSQKCKTSETRIWWNQQGTQGPQGPQGTQGQTGPAGPGVAVTQDQRCVAGGECPGDLAITDRDEMHSLVTVPRPTGMEWQRTIGIASLTMRNDGDMTVEVGCLFGNTFWEFPVHSNELTTQTLMGTTPAGTGTSPDMTLACRVEGWLTPPGDIDLHVTGHTTMALVPASYVHEIRH